MEIRPNPRPLSPLLNPAIKAEWIKRLTGGAYRQGKNVLCGPYGFCCLGVLGDIAVSEGLAHWDETVEETVDDESGETQLVDGPSELRMGPSRNSELAPEPLVNWACASPGHPSETFFVPFEGVKEIFPDVEDRLGSAEMDRITYGAPRDEPLAVSLDQLNDNGFTFAEIARVIEVCL